jgi:hypothetical protein
MALDTRRSNCLLLLFILAFHLHHALSQTTDSSLSLSLATTPDLTTFFTSTIVVLNSTTQLASTTTITLFSSSFAFTSIQATSTTSASPLSSASRAPPLASPPALSSAPYTSINRPSRFTTIATLTKRFRSDQGRESWNLRWCWRRRYSDFYRVSINVPGALEYTHKAKCC